MRGNLKFLGDRRGFSIIEMILGIGLIGILTLVLSAILVTAQRSAAIEKTRVDLISENRRLVDDTSRNIKLSSTVVSSGLALGTNYTTDSETLILDLPAVDADQNLISGVTDRLVYQKSGSDYEFIQDGGAGSVRPDTDSRIYSERMTALTFTFYNAAGTEISSNFQNAKSIRTNSTIEDTVREKTISSTMTETAVLRNK